jgi:hypothetical protein
MQIRVDLGGWEHDCCGDAYEINDVVTKDLYLPFSGTLSGGADYMESHHQHLSGGVSVTGRVVGIEVAGPDGQYVAVTRLPSGADLNDLNEDGSDAVVELATGNVLDIEPDEYIVILDVAEGSEFPIERARHAS